MYGAKRNVVMTLLVPPPAKGHVVYMDIYYTSPKLVAELKIAETGVTGTVRQPKTLSSDHQNGFKLPEEGGTCFNIGTRTT